jgi:SAM-dependent methyltransferase
MTVQRAESDAASAGHAATTSRQVSPPRGFHPAEYWERRLAADFTLSGVGFRRLGPSYNRWAYRVRRARFMDMVRTHVSSPGAVLDVGSGTGFYVACWEEMGAAAITGLDLTRTAVQALQRRYSQHRFVNADIGTNLADLVCAGLQPAAFDTVSAMDVLFHLVDDEAYARALANVRSLLRPGGLFVCSEMLVHGQPRHAKHCAFRTLPAIEQMLAGAGLELVDRRPLFVLMNDPVDARHGALRALWYAAAAVVGTSDRLGEFVGRRLYPWELLLTRSRRESPTTELVVCRAPP